MKPMIYELHGWIILQNEPHLNDFDWLTKEKMKDDFVFYFLPHQWSRAWFIRDIVPIIDNFILTAKAKETILRTSFNETLGMFHADIVEPFGKPLLGWQKDMVNRMCNNDRYALFLGTGTGKTLIAISYIMSLKPKTVAIYTKQKVVGQYLEQCAKYLEPLGYLVTDDLLEFQTSSTPAVHVTNYEQAHKMIGFNGDVLILDESHKAKTYGNEVNRTMARVADRFTRVYEFSGSPLDKNRFEIIGQLYLLDNHICPTKNRFVERFFVTDEYYRPTAETRKDELSAIISAYSYGKETEQLIELPPMEEHVIMCNHPAEIYNQLKEKHIYQSELGDAVCDSPAKLVTKLIQICCGFLYLDNGEILRLPNPKASAFRELIRHTANGIIYTRHDEDIVFVQEMLTDEKRTFVAVNGKTPKKKVTPLIQSFKDNQVEFLIMQVNAGDAGLDIWNTNAEIFYALPDSYVTFHQCQSRIRRYGKPGTAHFYYLICPDTVEMKVRSALAKKKSFVARSYKIY